MADSFGVALRIIAAHKQPRVILGTKNLRKMNMWNQQLQEE
jgi:hypothetical protein